MKIICVGRNYVEHARELNNDIPDEPVLFLKPDTALFKGDQVDFYLPDLASEIHYEVELVIRISKMGKHIAQEFASRYYDQVALGIDFTARDLQSRLKEKGLPWEKAKAFDYSAYLGRMLPRQSLPPMEDLNFSLEVNGQRVQEGSPRQMIFPVNALISQISRYFTLKTGDLIYTGTPAGVGAVQAGDALKLYINGSLNGQVRVK